MPATLKIAPRRRWPGGPLRQWNATRCPAAKMALDCGGFGGSYICDGCQMPAAGLYRAIDGVERRETWLCAQCRTRPKKPA